MSTAYAHGCLNTHHFNLDPLPTRLHITRTQNQLSFDCSAFEVKWYIELRLKWTLNLSISYLGDHCLSVRASSPLKLGSRKWWTALVWKNNPCWHFVSRSRIRHVEHMSAYPLLLSDPVLCNLVVFFFLAVNKEMMSLFSSFPPLSEVEQEILSLSQSFLPHLCFWHFIRNPLISSRGSLSLLVGGPDGVWWKATLLLIITSKDTVKHCACR